MTDPEPAAPDATPTQALPPETVLTFAEFLESTPPGQRVRVSDARHRVAYTGGGHTDHVAAPTIQLHCGSESCGGLRFFSSANYGPHYTAAPMQFFLHYACRNCGRTTKTYALSLAPVVTQAGGVVIYTEEAHATKFGELPPFGPPTPARLISLVGPDRDAYLKGRRAENQGLGIGAFAYYRRVVEEQKTRLIDEIIRVAERTQAPAEMVATLRAARGETQFRKAVDTIKGAIPESLKIDGHNPLALLHSALSEGLHAQTDEQCLELASSIRVVLEELAERAAVALKDHAELRSAVARLMTKR